MPLLAEALHLNEAARVTPAVAANHLNLGRVHLVFGEPDQAEPHLLKALELKGLLLEVLRLLEALL